MYFLSFQVFILTHYLYLCYYLKK